MITEAPGKLILAGEWSVLELGNPAIVLPLNMGVTVQVKQAERILISSDDIGLQRQVVQFVNGKLYLVNKLTKDKQSKFIFIQRAIEVVLQYIYENHIQCKNFALYISSEISKFKLPNGLFAKLGFGSSAAIVVAIVKSILKFHGFNIESGEYKIIIFKLSCIAHYLGQGRLGSSFDVAMATYSEPLVYQRFDAVWLERKLIDFRLVDVIKQGWPYLKITPICLPKELRVCVGFVGYSSSTVKFVGAMQKFKNERAEIYNDICGSISSVVYKLISELKNNKKSKILELIKQNSILLKELSKKSGLGLETQELSTLINIVDFVGGAGKFSGAGGGDCGIGICFDDKVAEKIMKEWNKVGIIPITCLKFN